MAPVCLYAKVIVSAQNAKLNVNKFYDRIKRGGPEEGGGECFFVVGWGSGEVEAKRCKLD